MNDMESPKRAQLSLENVVIAFVNVSEPPNLIKGTRFQQRSEGITEDRNATLSIKDNKLPSRELVFLNLSSL
jgi:hypothetical protein